jgi:hypothetical protein
MTGCPGVGALVKSMRAIVHRAVISVIASRSTYCLVTEALSIRELKLNVSGMEALHASQ